jgi:hypothetical protein
MKTSTRVLSVLAISVMLIPQVTFAAWWNPLTWWTTASSTPATHQIHVATTTAPIIPIIQITPKSKVVQKPKISTTSVVQVQPITTQPPVVQAVAAPVQLSPATPAEIAGIQFLCSLSTTQGNTELIKDCSDGTLWNGYNTNQIFRSYIDNTAQQTRQKLAAQQTAKLNCAQSLARPYDPTISAAANIQNSQFIDSACGLGSAPNQTSSQQPQIQQLQTSVDANTQAVQQLQQTQQQQYWQQEMQNSAPTQQTHCGVDAGVYRCGIPGFE